MRTYDPRVAKFFSVDPLARKYPELTPYQFAGDNPILFVDLDGKEPAYKGTKEGQPDIAAKIGTNDFYNWSWHINKKTHSGSWVQGNSTDYQFGDVAHVSSQDDNTKTYHPNVKVSPLTYNSISKYTPLPSADDNSLVNRYSEYSDAFGFATSRESNEDKSEAHKLLTNFVNGYGTTLTFAPTSGMAGLLGKDPAFLAYAKAFESGALQYYNSHNGNMEGFSGNDIMRTLGKPYIKGTLFMHAVMGGTQQWNAQIRQISGLDIQVQYTVWDRYGAGIEDASRSTLPGLPSMYWLQHNSTHFYPSVSNKYAPFIWNIKVNRTISQQ